MHLHAFHPTQNCVTLSQLNHWSIQEARIKINTVHVCILFLDILHTVGPGGKGKESENTLASCYKTCLKLVEENELRSVVSLPESVYYPNRVLKVETQL